MRYVAALTELVCSRRRVIIHWSGLDARECAKLLNNNLYDRRDFSWYPAGDELNYDDDPGLYCVVDTVDGPIEPCAVVR